MVAHDCTALASVISQRTSYAKEGMGTNLQPTLIAGFTSDASRYSDHAACEVPLLSPTRAEDAIFGLIQEEGKVCPASLSHPLARRSRALR